MWRAVPHNQFAKSRSPGPPDVYRFLTACARSPQPRFAHPSAQRLGGRASDARCPHLPLGAAVPANDGRDDRSSEAAQRLRPASNGLPRPPAIPSTAPAPSRSTRFAPVPCSLPPSIEPDISTLHKPDILILQRHLRLFTVVPR